MLNREELKMEMLSKVNKEALEVYIQKTDIGGIDKCNLKATLDAWAENKVDIYVKFDRQLRIEKKVECNIPDNQCERLRDEFIKENGSPKYMIANAFIKSIDMEESSNNYLERDYWLFGTRLAKGTRVSRCFKQMMPTKLVDDYQTKFSMFIQKFKVQGKAVVSIDPIDYLTMSVNNSGWRSCHIITNGIHKAGCLSYMIDESTAISFTTDKRITANQKYEGLSYDNKIWRQCVHIGDNFAIQARQYPGLNPSNRNNVADILKNIFNEHFDTDNFMQEEKGQEELYRLQYDRNGDAYNDISSGSFHKGGGLISSADKSDLNEKIIINTDAICVRCGERHVEHSNLLLCEECCEKVGYCDYNDED